MLSFSNGEISLIKRKFFDEKACKKKNLIISYPVLMYPNRSKTLSFWMLDEERSAKVENNFICNKKISFIRKYQFESCDRKTYILKFPSRKVAENTFRRFKHVLYDHPNKKTCWEDLNGKRNDGNIIVWFDSKNFPLRITGEAVIKGASLLDATNAISCYFSKYGPFEYDSNAVVLMQNHRKFDEKETTSSFGSEYKFEVEYLHCTCGVRVCFCFLIVF